MVYAPGPGFSSPAREAVVGTLRHHVLTLGSCECAGSLENALPYRPDMLLRPTVHCPAARTYLEFSRPPSGPWGKPGHLGMRKLETSEKAGPTATPVRPYAYGSALVYTSGGPCLFRRPAGRPTGTGRPLLRDMATPKGIIAVIGMFPAVSDWKYESGVSRQEGRSEPGRSLWSSSTVQPLCLAVYTCHDKI